MKDLQDLLELANKDKTKESAALGAGVGALLGLGNGNAVKNALVGAATGAALSWVASQYFTNKKQKETESPDEVDDGSKPVSE